MVLSISCRSLAVVLQLDRGALESSSRSQLSVLLDLTLFSWSWLTVIEAGLFAWH